MNSGVITLPQVYPFENPRDYKLHLATFNGEFQPLDCYVSGWNEWQKWNEYGAKTNLFPRPYILAFMDFYPQKEHWLFGGAFKVLSYSGIHGDGAYQVEVVEESRPYIGRLKIAFKRPGQSRSLRLENYLERLVVTEILPEAYSGEHFPGYDQIDVSFTILENLIQRQKADWKAALTNAKGVYLISDTKTGKRYVGSAYGNIGIWSRWACYAKTAHGYNDELTRLIKKMGMDYARQHFRFSLLEYFPMKTEDHLVIDRESYWKRVLMSREPWGYNKN